MFEIQAYIASNSSSLIVQDKQKWPINLKKIYHHRMYALL